MFEVSDVFFGRERRDGCISHRIGYLPDHLRAQISGREKTRHAGFHTIIRYQVPADIMGRVIFQEIRIGFEPDEDEDTLCWMLCALVSFQIFEHRSINLFIALYLVNYRVPYYFNP